VPMNVLSLFSGIGGLNLGLQRAGMRIVGQVEIDTFCQRVLSQHWPQVPRHDDVRTTLAWWRSEPRPRVDLVCGGSTSPNIPRSITRVAGRHGGRTTTNGTCGTTYCLAGHALALSGEDMTALAWEERYGDKIASAKGLASGTEIADAAATLLGLDDRQESALFGWSNSIEDLWQLAEELTGGEITRPVP